MLSPLDRRVAEQTNDIIVWRSDPAPTAVQTRRDLRRLIRIVRHTLDLAEIAARSDPRRAARYLVDTAADLAPEMVRLRVAAAEKD